MDKANIVLIAPSAEESAPAMVRVAMDLKLDPDDTSIRNAGTMNIVSDKYRMFYLHHANQLKTLKNVLLVYVGDWRSRRDIKEIEKRIKILKIHNRVAGEMR